MGNVFTLDSLREEVEREFAPVKIVVSDGSEVTLRNILRLPKKQREKVMEKLRVLESAEKSDDEGDSDQIGRLAAAAIEVLALVADHSDKLVEDLDGDAGVILKVLGVWMESSQPGEAQPSPA